MISPSPTSKIDPHLARGTLGELYEPTATKPGYLVFEVPNTSYQLHLRPTAPITASLGKRILGTIKGKARRVDVVDTGGRYIEPVEGRPRRVQGTIVSTDDAANSITVNAAVPFVCVLADERQRAKQFQPGQLVAFDLPDGATFTPEA